MANEFVDLFDDIMENPGKALGALIILIAVLAIISQIPQFFPQQTCPQCPQCQPPCDVNVTKCVSDRDYYLSGWWNCSDRLKGNLSLIENLTNELNDTKTRLTNCEGNLSEANKNLNDCLAKVDLQNNPLVPAAEGTAITVIIMIFISRLVEIKLQIGLWGAIIKFGVKVRKLWKERKKHKDKFPFILVIAAGLLGITWVASIISDAYYTWTLSGSVIYLLVASIIGVVCITAIIVSCWFLRTKKKGLIQTALEQVTK